jgi:hypothetical protein
MTTDDATWAAKPGALGFHVPEHPLPIWPVRTISLGGRSFQ